MDFDESDGAIWPMYVTPEGDKYGFCPAKATWDLQISHLYQSLVITAETGNLLYNGSIQDQPNWYVDLLAWFLSRYDQYKFLSKADMILGDSSKSKPSNKPSPSRIRQR